MAKSKKVKRIFVSCSPDVPYWIGMAKTPLPPVFKEQPPAIRAYLHVRNGQKIVGINGIKPPVVTAWEPDYKTTRLKIRLKGGNVSIVLTKK